MTSARQRADAGGNNGGAVDGDPMFTTRQRDMAAFDELPFALRERLRYAAGQFSAECMMKGLMEGYAAEYLIDLIGRAERNNLMQLVRSGWGIDARA